MADSEEFRDIVADFNDVFLSDQGKRVLEHIISNICFVKSPTFLSGSIINSETSLYMAGRKDVGIAITNILNYDFTSLKRKKR